MGTKSSQEGFQSAIRSYVVEEVAKRVYATAEVIVDAVLLDVKARYAVDGDVNISIPIQIIVQEFHGEEC